MSLPAITRQLLSTITAARAGGREPQIVFDLDSTLYDDRLRTLRILHEYAYANATTRPEFLKVALAMGIADMPYRVVDAVRAMGFADRGLLTEIQAYWTARFFTSDYVSFDLPTPGAAQAMRLLMDAGALAICLTGRAAAPMLGGTMATLQRDGLPVGTADCRLILKPATKQSDERYKSEVVARLQISGPVIAAFDNEPGICNMIQQACPEAVVFHVATTWTTDAPQLDPRVQVIADFTALLG